MLDKLFAVATEFKFEIGSALLNTEALKSRVDQLSGAADTALVSFQKLSMGVLSSMGAGPVGMLTALNSGVKASQKFADTQIALATIVAANRDHLVGPIDSFNEKLEFSEQILESIGKKAREFAISGTALAEMTKVMAPILIPKGLAGTNFDTAIDMSRGLLKSSNILQVDPMEVQGQLLRAIEGGASMGDTLFRRLVGETQAFQGIGAGNAKGSSAAFNAMPAQKRVELLQRALTQFGNIAEGTSARVNSLSGQMQVMRTLIDPQEYITNIFRPLGAAIEVPLRSILTSVNKYLDKEARETIAIFAKVFAPMIQAPRDVALSLLTMKKLSTDLAISSKAAGLLGLVFGFSAMAKFAAKLPIIGPLLVGFWELLGSTMWKGLASLGRGLLFIINPLNLLRGAMVALPVLAKGLSMLGGVLLSIAGPVALIFTLMQIISRATAMARINDAEITAKLVPKMAQLGSRIMTALERIFSPFARMIDGLASLIEPLFRMSNVLRAVLWLGNQVAWVLELMASSMEALEAIATGLFVAFIRFMDDLVAFNFAGMLERVWESYKIGLEDTMQEFERRRRDAENPAVVQNVTNIGTVQIQNQFKEQMEPDRIAFTLASQLMKIAQNPTQARGQSFRKSNLPGGG